MSSNAVRTMPYEIKTASSKYAEEYLKLDCTIDMRALKLFPNFKEITESFGAFNAVRTKLKRIVNLQDPTITLFSVGDGSTPRTAATFAFRTKWQCNSIDPNLKMFSPKQHKWPIDRLECHWNKIESLSFEVERAIIIAVHSHVSIPVTLEHIRAKERIVVAIPCCVPLGIPGVESYAEYRDWGIWSPHNKVKIWVLKEGEQCENTPREK